MESNSKLRIAHLAGPNATIQNTPPLVTSNKAADAQSAAPEKSEWQRGEI